MAFPNELNSCDKPGVRFTLSSHSRNLFFKKCSFISIHRRRTVERRKSDYSAATFLESTSVSPNEAYEASFLCLLYFLAHTSIPFSLHVINAERTSLHARTHAECTAVGTNNTRMCNYTTGYGTATRCSRRSPNAFARSGKWCPFRATFALCPPKAFAKVTAEQGIKKNNELCRQHNKAPWVSSAWGKKTDKGKKKHLGNVA